MRLDFSPIPSVAPLQFLGKKMPIVCPFDSWSFWFRHPCSPPLMIPLPLPTFLSLLPPPHPSTHHPYFGKAMKMFCVTIWRKSCRNDVAETAIITRLHLPLSHFSHFRDHNTQSQFLNRILSIFFPRSCLFIFFFTDFSQLQIAFFPIFLAMFSSDLFLFSISLFLLLNHVTKKDAIFFNYVLIMGRTESQ